MEAYPLVHPGLDRQKERRKERGLARNGPLIRFTFRLGFSFFLFFLFPRLGYQQTGVFKMAG